METGDPIRHMVGASTSQRIAHIPDELQRVEKQIEVVAQLVSQLEERMSPAMRPEPASGESNKIAADRPYTAVPLAQNLAQAYGRLNSISARLNSVLERIEF